MRIIVDYFRKLYRSSFTGWSRFWFTPSDPTTLCLIRVLAGSLLLYTHLVWSLDLQSFFGPKGWVSPEALAAMPGSRVGVWSHLFWIHSPTVLWISHIAALAVLLLFILGFMTRVMAVLAYLITVSYANRLIPQALFGLDDINAMLSMYLMLGPCGAKYSIDAWLRRRRAGEGGPLSPTVSANFAIRLIQVHMCVIYFFSALGKLAGGTWLGGQALWLAAANLEYQSVDLTWLAGWPRLINALTISAVLWELFYPVLIWPRLTRPLMLAMAVLVHGGIAIFLGMQTFGLAMLIGNLAFVRPDFLRNMIERKQITATGAGQGSGDNSLTTKARKHEVEKTRQD